MSEYKKFWECICDCGRKTVAEQSNLLSGHTRSCGCLRGQMKRGFRFGKLTLLSPAPMKHDMRYWNVRCDCGRIHTVSKDVLLRAASVYCDCGSGKSKLDLTGQVFSRLTVLMEVDPVVTSQGALESCWLCRCECGKEVIVRQKNLLYKNTRSCGCLKRKPKSITKIRLLAKTEA